MSELKNKEQELLNKAVKDGGSYSLIAKRLATQGDGLLEKINSLNTQRQEEFGGLSNEIIGKLNVRTENNAVPVDMVQIKGNLIIGYDVFLGMKKDVEPSDLFSIYKIKEEDNSFSTEEIDINASFMADSEFRLKLGELFKYYKDAKLTQILKTNNYLFMNFKIGRKDTDIKVFRWLMKTDGTIEFKDDSSKDYLPTPESHDFKWTKCSRDNFVKGKHPHVSILDKVYVETIGGDLTIKIEDNTESGEGIYSEEVEDKKQSLEDSEISYAQVGTLILINILPYREEKRRYFVYDTTMERVTRIDSIGNSCLTLPEDHGIVFPNGYYLENGDFKIFEQENEKLKYMNTLASPNGEDYLITFYDSSEGFYTLYSYNIIKKKLESPIHAHGFGLYEDGKMFIFRESENHEASKVHPLRVWQTPYTSDEFFSSQEKAVTYLSKIGNAELVRAISDLFEIVNYVGKEEVNSQVYEALIKKTVKISDDYQWLGDSQVNNILENVKELNTTAELVVDEFEKVKNIQKESARILMEAKKKQKTIVSEITTLNKSDISENVQALAKVKSQIGHLISIKEERYIDVQEIESLEEAIDELRSEVNKNLLNVLQNKSSFDTYYERIEKVEAELVDVEKAVEITPLEEESLVIQGEIELINNEVNDIEIEDATIVTDIIDIVSEVFAKLNQVKSKIKNKKKDFLSTEAKTEFASQFKLLSQSVSAAVSKADTPDKCDEELSRLMNQVESLESKFGQFDEYIEDITKKREEISDIFENHKLQLINEIQKRIVNIEKAANITISSISKKVESFDSIDGLNTYFASDSMVLKIHKFVEDIRELGNSVKADDLESKLKKIKDQSLRSLRDNQDIFEDGGKIMKMGKHRFTVNKNDVDLTILPIEDKLSAHLTGTDFYETIENDELYSLREYWDLDLPSESKAIYRAEYLAYSIIDDAEKGTNDLSLTILNDAVQNETLSKLVSKYAAVRYKEGYIKGVHDYDATLILNAVLKTYFNVGLLKYSQRVRSLAIFIDVLQYLNEEDKVLFNKKYAKAKVLAEKLKNFKELDSFYNTLYNSKEFEICNVSDAEKLDVAKYLSELRLLNNDNKEKMEVEVTKDAVALCSTFKDFLLKIDMNLDDLKADSTFDNFENIVLWIESFVESENKEDLKYFTNEAATIFMMDEKYNFIEKGVRLTSNIKGLLGDHSLVDSGDLLISLDDFMARGKHQKDVVVPSYERYLEIRKNMAVDLRERLQLDSFKARPLSSFVRNKLITNSYLHLIGDNLAKQIGTAGDSKRTDLMGMLLLISPPGYGKTTLIEYVANKLGLVFMKINCPSLNHSVVSLDPAEAPDATSRKELEKLNLGLEMGNNVLLYLDDIQHTNPEFLQKFISLCDGTRKIDGVWKGKPKTYDLKGKKFAVCMAGNPYTETGEAFTIPDMLANRADIYNLGDQLNGQEDVFELSYIENSLTSNSVLSPLANRDMNDLYKFVDMAKGKSIPLNELDHNYSSAEANEIVSVIKKMLTIQNVVLTVNKQYILSASIEDKYRDEPPFKLQGSYRNMNKMVEKIIPVMTDDEVMALILDHYKGESQTLTVGAEDNYLKLKSLIGVMTDEEKERYAAIMSDFNRHKLMGDSETDGSTKIANQLITISEILAANNASGKSSATEVDEAQNREIQLLNELMAQNSDSIRNNKKLMISSFQFIKQLRNQINANGEKEELIVNLLENLNAILTKRKSKNEDL